MARTQDLELDASGFSKSGSEIIRAVYSPPLVSVTSIKMKIMIVSTGLLCELTELMARNLACQRLITHTPFREIIVKHADELLGREQSNSTCC